MGRASIEKLVEGGWPDDVLMNVNFPDCAPGDVTGVEVTAQGKRDMQQAILDRRTDLRGNPYYWIGFKRVQSKPEPGTDLAAIIANKISVTPLHLNLTEICGARPSESGIRRKAMSDHGAIALVMALRGQGITDQPRARRDGEDAARAVRREAVRSQRL